MSSATILLSALRVHVAKAGIPPTIYIPLNIFYCPNITKTRRYNLDPLKPHFYIVKLGFTGVYIIFLISALLEPPIYILSRNKKNIRIFYLKILIILVVKCSIYLNRLVFVMYLGLSTLQNVYIWHYKNTG